MKKILTALFLSLFFINLNNSFAYTQKEKLAADFLSYKDIINSQEKAEDYNLDKEITRREMSKVTIKLSWISVFDNCSEIFWDLKKWDWWCKYAELWVKNNFFAKNKNFNPDNNISKIEALKMVMKARKIEKENIEDWKKWYVKSAVKSGLLEKEFSDYDTKATRWWIFILAQRAIEYSWNDEDIKLIEELLNL